MAFDLFNPLIGSAETAEPTKPILVLFSSESDHMTSSYSSVSYASFRPDAIYILDTVWQVDCSDPFIPYLAINYMDRFFSELPSMEGKPWAASLVVASCLSLAAKMRNVEISISKNGGWLDEKTLNRMEMMVLEALNWRMRSITPFCFLHFFSSMVEPEGSAGLITERAKEIVFRAQHEFNMLEFKPSVVAASAILEACQEMLPLQFFSLYSSIFSCELVNMDNLERCLNNIRDKVAGCGGSTVDAETPLSVLSWDSDASEANSITPNSATSTFDVDDVRGKGLLTQTCVE